MPVDPVGQLVDQRADQMEAHLEGQEDLKARLTDLKVELVAHLADLMVLKVELVAHLADLMVLKAEWVDQLEEKEVQRVVLVGH